MKLLQEGLYWHDVIISCVFPAFQEAFELHKASCASQINERQKRIHLASEQRHLDEGYAAERAMLFADKRRKMANPEAHPYSGQL